MRRRLLPVALVLVALVAQARDRQELAFYVLVAAVPAAAVAVLAAFGDLVELPRGAPGEARARVLAALDAVALVLIVVAAAALGQAPQNGDVPALAVSAIVAGLVVFVAQGLAALAAWTPPVSAPVRVRDREAPAGLQ